jgi:2-polyprenyl-3-methyl-5-hydroxy-6-metoxy-1,4-benzoquinol methylase
MTFIDFKTSNCVENTCCLVCKNKDIRTILDLGNQPLANNYHKNIIQEVFPLKLNLCPLCWHLQLSHIINPDLMFKHYLYVSGTSKTLKDYFSFFANKTLEYYPKAKTVLDIACNDGTQLDFYKALGLDTTGIDPAKNLYETSSNKGHKIVCNYFNTNNITLFGDKTFDIILAQNVFAHTPHIHDFLSACNKIMHNDSVLFVQTSQANMIENGEFDTIYHEHVSFFNTNSMKTIIEKNGFVLHDVFKTDIHGTSYVFVISKTKNQKQTIKNMLEEETKQGLYDIMKYPNYSLKCYKTTFELKNKLNELKNQGYKIIGYGAAAKGNTLLNFGCISLDFIIDDNPLKNGLLTPGMNIPIVNIDILTELHEEKIVFIPLAWNFYKEIKEKIKHKRNNNKDVFIKYFPNIIVES